MIDFLTLSWYRKVHIFGMNLNPLHWSLNSVLCPLIWHLHPCVECLWDIVLSGWLFVSIFYVSYYSEKHGCTHNIWSEHIVYFNNRAKLSHRLYMCVCKVNIYCTQSLECMRKDCLDRVGGKVNQWVLLYIFRLAPLLKYTPSFRLLEIASLAHEEVLAGLGKTEAPVGVVETENDRDCADGEEW